jgi:hypothetical protein
VINDLWYKNAIINCLSVSSFMDANGDGTGDFPGLMRRLDYLQGLGVSGGVMFSVSVLKSAAPRISTERTCEPIRTLAKHCFLVWFMVPKSAAAAASQFDVLRNHHTRAFSR